MRSSSFLSTNEVLTPGAGAPGCRLFKSRLMVVAQNPGCDRPHRDRELPREKWPVLHRLDAWLQAAGYPSGTAWTLYFTNAFPYSSDRRGAPTAARIRENQEWLDEQIREVDPDVIVTLGAIAFSAVTWGSTGQFDGGTGKRLVDLLGTRISVFRSGKSRLVVPFPHPSGRNRLFNDEEGRQKLADSIKVLKSLKRNSFE